METEPTNEQISFASDPRFLHQDVKVDEKLFGSNFRDGVELKPHQKQGVAFMLEREQIYQSGGIIMDEAGLGKTFQTLAAIAANPSVGPTLVVCPASILHIWSKEMENFFKDNTFQILRYDSKRNLKKKEKEFNIVLTTYGIVAREYNRPQPHELVPPTWKEESIFNKMHFGRIILDEAHHTRNTKSQWVQPLKELCSVAPIVWCMTATPIVNKISDMWNIVQMIKAYPLCERSVWDNVMGSISRTKTSQEGVDALKEYLSPVLIRRTKDLIPNMTGITCEDVYLDFSPPEREFYDALFEYSKKRVEKFIRLIDSMKEQQGWYDKNSLRAKNRMRKMFEARTGIFSLLHRLRQACCSPNIVMKSMRRLNSVIQSDPMNDMSKDQLLNAIERLKQVDQENECPVCFDDDVSMEVASSCLHVVCKTCWEKLRKNKRPCPICRSNFDETSPVEEQMETLKTMLSEIDEPTKEEETEEEPEEGFYIPSAKIEYIMKELKTCFETKEENKFLIVSEWKGALYYVQQEFRKRFPEIESCQLDGSSNTQQRSIIVDRFQTDENIRVCFVSMKSASEGLTLTAANRVIFLNLGWNDSDEYQMANRIHRVGQVKDVVIQRLHIRDSVEMSMREIRRMKKFPSQVLIGNATFDPKKDSMNGIKLIFDLKSEKPTHYLKRRLDYEKEPTVRNTRPRTNPNPADITSLENFIDLTADIPLPCQINEQLSLEEIERILLED